MNRITRLPRPPRREPAAHKGDFGHALIVGGAVGMSGSVALAGRAALRAGAGLATIACPASSQPIVAALVPEAMTIPLPQRPDGRIDPTAAGEVFARHGGRWTALGAGCGWGTAGRTFADQSVALLEQLAHTAADKPDAHGPAVIDADGLNLLATTRRLTKADWPNLVITPHPGELARLLGSSAREIQADRMAAAEQAVARFGGPVLVLKGRCTIVMDPRRYYVNTTGNPGMATGGTGDVLTGVIAGLLAGGMEPFDAAVLGVYVHGLAGDLAARRHGQISLIAGDLIERLGEAFLKVAAPRTRVASS